MADWEVVIGMEVHAQPATRTKMFCSCSSDYLGKPPNSNVCEVCLGMPGVLPVVNRVAVEQCLRTAIALNCEIPRFTKFDRKNYFYPDLPKGYQISQYDLPMSREGWIEVDGRRVRITRVHLEEDTGKSVHEGDQLQHADRSFVDLNRSGMPLMEIVTEPDIRSADEARDYVVALRGILRTIGASQADMEKGQLRAEANVSVRPAGSEELGVKTELKNINSFRALHRAIQFEVRRQIDVIERGGKVEQETRGWSEQRQATYSQRSKEFAQDYRYFPEPDLPPLEMAADWVERLRAALPELPAARRARFETELGLSAHDAGLLAREPEVADYYEQTLAAGAAPKPAANWTIGEVLPRLHESGEGKLRPEGLAAIVALVENRSLNRDQGREVLEAAWETGASPSGIVAERGLAQVSDEAALGLWVDQAISAQPQAAADYRAGKAQAIGVLIGEVKRISGGKSDARLTRELLERRLTP